MRKKQLICELKNRVHELEEILCPCEQHDLVEVYTYNHYDNDGFYMYPISVYVCRRCKKQIEK